MRKEKKMIVNELDVKHLRKKNHVIDRYLCDYSYSLDFIFAFPNKTSKKEITRWLVNNGYEEYTSTPCYENDGYYWGSAGSRYGSEVVRRGNKVYIFSKWDV